MGSILKPVTFKPDLCFSIYILKPLLKAISVLCVLVLQEQICRSLCDAIDLAEFLFASDSWHVPAPVKIPKARGHCIRKSILPAVMLDLSLMHALSK